MTGNTEQRVTMKQALDNAAALLPRQPALALRQANEVLRLVPNQPSALLIAAAANTRSGNPAQAIALLRPVLDWNAKDWAEARQEIGIAYARLARDEEAVIELRRAVHLKPALRRAWLELGGLLARMGRRAESATAFEEYNRCARQLPELKRCAQMISDQRYPDAERTLRTLLGHDPEELAILRLLAELATLQERSLDAVNCLQAALRIAPGYAALEAQCAVALMKAQRPVDALALAERVLESDPGNQFFRNLKASALCKTGDFVQGVSIYEALLNERPENAKTWLSLGHARKTLGDMPGAIEAYQRAIESDETLGEPWWSLANLKTFKFTETDVARMLKQVAASGGIANERAQLEFALGKALEDAKDFDESFVHYARGNAIVHSASKYSRHANTERMLQSAQLFTSEFFSSRQGWGASAADPIFVVGLPRSGSTLVEQILSSHPLVEGTDELHEIVVTSRELRRLAPERGHSGFAKFVSSLSQEQWMQLGERYLERTRIQRKTDAPFFIDKMPNNFLHIGLIQMMLPNAKIIDTRRHPLGCCFSGFKQFFASGQEFSYGLEEIGTFYRDYVRLMDHFDQALPGRVHRVIYERMVEETEAEVRRLLDYCGLPFAPECLRFFENTRPVRTPSAEQVRQPIYRSGMEQWQNFEKYLDPLKSALGPVLESYPDVPPRLGEAA